MTDYQNTYWGVPSSLVNWCEPDYMHFNFIAETWNTLSNIFTILMGLMLFINFTWHKIELRFRITALSLMVVGMGSFAFHGTLLYHYQLLDELPMLGLGASMTYLILEMPSIQLRYPRMPTLFTAFCICFCVLHVILKNNDLFFAVFAIMLAPAVFFSALNYQDKVIRTATTLAGVYLAIGFGFWLIDRFYCSSVQKLNLHAWWHILTALSEVYWLNAMVYMRRKIIGQKSVLYLKGLWISFPITKLK